MWYYFMSVHAIQSIVQCWFYPYSMLSRIYVTVNAFRSLFPVKIVERECLTAVSSPLIDRSLATLSELCFAKQLAAQVDDSTIVYYASVAQACCWLGIMTQNNIFHVYEEFLWLLIGYTFYWHSKHRMVQLISLGYCGYMMFADIPMYMGRLIEQESIPTMYPLYDCQFISDLSMDEKVWRTGYFVGASRLSMFMN